ncbi:MAG: bifunctional hydroxymethylpyrimidine kinase/phosphomethylpyrimidine kinase [Pseudomonadota bacterium]|nr:bifunctional hydroxymethylpyrimidine kinase/phosphomethylpyrimidine kinase [Pseudomonadota bacterium]
MKGRVLIVAGSDSGGGAGIQADIKTVTALGGFAATAITALTAQDTTGVHGVHLVPIDFIRQQMQVVLGDIGADCIKTGMLHSSEVIEAVTDVIERNAAGIPVVVDPVMVAKGGAALLDPDATTALKSRILKAASVITPNLPEAEVLIGMTIENLDDMTRAGDALLEMGARAAIIKGGHLPGAKVHDLLVTPNGNEVFSAPRMDTKHTHGTGCTMASALATGLAQGMTLRNSLARAQSYVHDAIRNAPGIGSGHGPIAHGHTVKPYMTP